ncbi:S9 family peptidase [Brevundimonas sp.]
MNNRTHCAIAALAILCALPGAPVQARQTALAGPDRTAVQDPSRRTVTLDDALAMETFGSTAVSPDGRWVVYERRGPYDSSPRYDRGHRSAYVTTRLMIAPIDGSRAPEPLTPTVPGNGLLFGSWSPDGRHLLVYRLDDRRLEAGIVSLADRSIHWTSHVPELPLYGVGHAWLDDRRLALTIRPDGSLPWMMRFDGPATEVVAERWARAVEGQRPSRTRFETRGGRVTTDAPPLGLQVVILDTETRAERIVAEGLIRDIEASPEGHWLAVTASAGAAPSDPSGIIRQSAVQRLTRLTLVETATGRTVAAPGTLDVAPNLLRWSPQGDAILVWARDDGQSWSDAGLRALDLSGALRVFDSEDLLPLGQRLGIDELQAVQADWFGEGAILRARLPGSERRDWWMVGAGKPRNLTAELAVPPSRLAAVAEDGIRAFADGRLWSLAADGLMQPMTPPGEDLTDGQAHTLMVTARARVNSPPRRDWTVARSPSGTFIVGGDGRYGPTTSSAGCGGTVLGRSASEAAVATACLDQGVETLTLGTTGGERQLDRVNAGFADLDIPQARAIPHRDHLGRETTSYLFMPPGVEPDQVKGLLVLVYPSVVDDGRYVEATSLAILGPRSQMLAAGGYAVLSAAVSSETDSQRSTMIASFARDTDLAVDATLAAVPGLPEERMAVIGHSFGGYTALSIATVSDRFKSYIAWAGVSDLASKWGELGFHLRTWPSDYPSLDVSVGRIEMGQAGMGGPPWADVEGYAAASPFMQADKIDAPLLLITADLDYVVQTQSERMLSAMHRQGKWARMVTYWGEGHSNSSPANVRDVYREIFDWLERTLGPEAVNARTDAAPMPEPSPRSPPSP